MVSDKNNIWQGSNSVFLNVLECGTLRDTSEAFFDTLVCREIQFEKNDPQNIFLDDQFLKIELLKV